MKILNNPDMCLVCFKKPEKNYSLIKHHVKYFPEEMAFVHFKCHAEIHDGKHPHLIQYKEGDSRKFYDQQKACETGCKEVVSFD
jgi:hypothetical protein